MKEHETLTEDLDLEALLEAERALHQTMVFSEEDMKKLRKRNLQPQDSDYFDQVVAEDELFHAASTVSSVEMERQHPITERALPNAEKIASTVVTKAGSLSSFSERSTESQTKHTQSLPAIQAALDNNEFTYHSKVKRPIEEASEPVEQHSKWNLSELLVAHYDIDYLEPLEVYNQFEKVTHEEVQQEQGMETSLWDNVAKKLKAIRANLLPSRNKETEPNEKKQVGPKVQQVTEAQNVVDTEDLESVTPELNVTQEVVSDITLNEGHESEEKAVNHTETIDEQVEVSTEMIPDNSNQEVSEEAEESLTEEQSEKVESTPTLDSSTEALPNKEDSGTTDKIKKKPEGERLKGVSSPEFADTLDLTETKVLSTEAIQAYEQELSKKSASFRESILTDHSFEEYLVDDDLTVSEELNDELNEKQTIVRGAAWLTFGNIFSRILGAIYVLPWAAWLGAEYLKANSLFSIGYTIYAFFLAVATAGFPSAIAKQIAFYHSKKEYKTADKLFKVSMGIMVGTGVFAATLLYVVAPFYVSYTATNNPTAAIVVVRSLVPALLILPMMSLLRGYFQGFNDMMPTAVSQVLEQIARVIYMLGATYAIMELYNGQAANAVVHSTFAAFIGGMISLLYLIFIYLRQLPKVNALIKNDHKSHDIDLWKIVKIMVIDSIPFIVLGSGIIIAQLIDTLTFSSIIHFATTYTNNEIEELFGVLSLDVNKLIMIIISLAIGISLSSIPAISRKFAEGDKKGTGELIEHICLLFTCVMMPAAIGMASIAKMVYQLFYANGSQHGPALLVSSSYLSIVLGLYTVLSTILQSMNYRRKSMKYLLVGLLVKFAAQFPLMYFLHTQGAVYSTLIGFLVASALMWRRIHRDVPIRYVDFLPKLALLVLGSVVMGIATYFWGQALDGLFGEVGRLMTFVKVFGVVILGVLVYGAILAVTGLLSLLMGERYRELQDKLRLF